MRGRLSILVASAALIVGSRAMAQTPAKAEPPYWYDDADDQATIYFLSSNDVAMGGYLAIFGDDFMDSGRVTLGGVDVPVVGWSRRRVVVSVPQGSVGPVVVVPTGGKASSPYSVVVHGGHVFHIDANAPVGGDGSQAAPWRDFASANAAAHPGDFVVCHAGTYASTNESVWRATTSGSAGNEITYFAKPGDTVVVDGSQAIKEAVRIEGAYVNVVGVVARGSLYQGVLITGSHSRVVDCEVKDGNGTISTKGQGINIIGASSSALGNYVHDNYSHGFYIHANDLQIGYNYVASSGCCGAPAASGYGVQLYLVDPGPTFSRVRVYRNYITSSNRSGIVVGLYADQADVYENIVTNNKERAIIVNYGATGSQIHNNTVYKNDASGQGFFEIDLFQGTDANVYNNAISGSHGLIKRATTTGSVRIDANIYDGTTAWSWDGTNYGSLTSWRSATGVDAASQAASPLYRNPGASDFRPASGSPMIDAGNDAQCARPILGSHCDEGAFESAGSPGDSTPPATPASLRRTDRH